MPSSFRERLQPQAASDGQDKRSWGALKSGKLNISEPPECKPCVVRPLWEKQFRLLELRRQSGTGCSSSNQPPGSMVTTSAVAARQAHTSMVRMSI